MYKYLSIVVFLLLYSCKSDSVTQSSIKAVQQSAEQSSSQLVESSTTSQVNTDKSSRGELLGQPKIDVVAAPSGSKLPRKENWKYVDSFQVKGANLSGVAAANTQIVLVSDTTSKVIFKVDLETRLSEPVVDGKKVPYLNLRNARLMMPDVELNGVYVYRGDPEIYQMQIPHDLNEPTGIDAFRIDDYNIVDRGNNRLLVTTKEASTFVGSRGVGEHQFDSPSCVYVIGNSKYVSDTGNGRIQVLNQDKTFRQSFGSGLLSRPGGLTSDNNLLFVCDEDLEQIFVFDQTGKLYYSLDENLIDPRDIFFWGGRLFVTDVGGWIKVFENKVYLPS